MRYVIGIDEVGRGPLAGPVVVAAAAIPLDWRPTSGKERGDLKDSKKLTQLQREAWAKYLSSRPNVKYALAKCFPKTIDEKNIAQSANHAAKKAVLKLLKELDGEVEGIYLDGGLYLKKLRHPRKRSAFHSEDVLIGGLAFSAHTVIKGDDKITAIKIAAVLAKVHRDALMDEEAKRYPGYGFERHKGYATKSHKAALLKMGPTPIHRLTYLRGV